MFFAFPVFGDLPDHYEKMSGVQKQAAIMERIQGTEYRRLPDLNLPSCGMLLGSIGTALDLRTSFTHVSDELPEGREKVIHPLGTVAPVVFEPEPNSPFTGVFGGKAVPGIARMSLAGSPLILGYTPGMALKFLIDGKPSVNLHVMHSVNGQGSNWNFFEHPFTNRLPEPEGILANLFAIRFAVTAKNPTQLSLAEAASIDGAGHTPSQVKTPYQIWFEPRLMMDPNTVQDFRNTLSTIAPQTPIYDVYATDRPGGEKVKIGTLRNTGPFISSEYGDQNLFFRHFSETLR